MAWIQRLYEDFSVDLGDLLSDANNGSVTVTGGELVIACPGGIICGGWTGGGGLTSPIVYREFSHYKVLGSDCYRVEAGWSQYNRTGSDETQVVFGVFTDESNSINWRQRYNDANDWWNGYHNNGTQTSLWGWASWLSRGAGSRVRIYANLGPVRRWFPDINTWVEPAHFGFAFSTDYGYSYTLGFLSNNNLGQLGYEIDPKFVIGLISYGSFPQTDIVLDDLYVHELDVGESHETDQSKSSAGISDGARFGSDSEVGDGGDLLQNVRMGSGGPFQEYDSREKTHVRDAGISDSHNMGLGAPTVSQQERPNFPYNQSALSIGYREGVDGEDRTHRGVDSGLSDSEDETVWRIAGVVQFRQDTLDPEAHVHFSSLNPIAMYYYRTEGEPWANPTSHNFTGFARDGTRYTNGVQDAGPVQAPWAAESAGGNRSARDDFPLEALLVATASELIIYDLDNWPTSLGVWMRFERSDVSSWNMIAGVNETIRSCSMKNGTLVVGNSTASSYGGLVIVNFKADDTQDVAHLIRSDNHYWWDAAYDLRDRNSQRWTATGVSPSLRLDSEHVYSVDIYDGHGGEAWAAVGGEDYDPQIVSIKNDHPQWVATAGGPLDERGVANAGERRQVLFDESGWFWFSIENRLYRAVYDYQGGKIVYDQGGPQRGVTFPEALITSLAQGRNYVYVGTERGVYRVHKGSLRANLAYTIVGGGGGGLLGNPPDGEVLAGESPYVVNLHCISVDKSSILQVVTQTSTGSLGGATTIRLADDVILASRKYPDLPEDEVFVGISTVGV